MPQPTASDAHIDAALTNISVAYVQSAENFIASKVFPRVPVKKQSDKYYTFDKNSWMLDQMQRRAPGDPSAGSGYTLSNTTYFADVWALHKDISDQERRNADTGLLDDAAAAAFLTQMGLIRQEVQWVADYFTTSVWGTDLTPGNKWSDFAASTPIEDIRTGARTILTNTGFLPNTLVLGYQVWEKLQDHPDIVDRVKYAGEKNVTLAALATILGVERLLVSQAAYATNDENATAAYTMVAGKHALLCYSTKTPGLKTPTAGYTFDWGEMSPVGSQAVYKFRMEELKSDRVELEMAWDYKVIGTDLGYFFNAAVA